MRQFRKPIFCNLFPERLPDTHPASLLYFFEGIIKFLFAQFHSIGSMFSLFSPVQHLGNPESECFPVTIFHKQIISHSNQNLDFLMPVHYLGHDAQFIRTPDIILVTGKDKFPGCHPKSAYKISSPSYILPIFVDAPIFQPMRRYISFNNPYSSIRGSVIHYNDLISASILVPQRFQLVIYEFRPIVSRHYHRYLHIFSTAPAAALQPPSYFVRLNLALERTKTTTIEDIALLKTCPAMNE